MHEIEMNGIQAEKDMGRDLISQVDRAEICTLHGIDGFGLEEKTNGMGF